MTIKPSDLLTLIATHAPKLRAAGVKSLTIEGVSMELLPAEPPPAPRPTAKELAAAQAASAVPLDPLDDPMSYPGGVVPRYASETPEPRSRGRRKPPTDEHDDD